MTTATNADTDVVEFRLADAEVEQIRAAVTDLATAVSSSEDAALYRRASVRRELPERLLEFLYDFRSTESAGACVIRGWHVDDAAIGPTPAHWRESGQRGATLSDEIYLVLLASALGEVYAWNTVQNGHLVQDLLPIPGEELEKNAGSSDSLLDLHTEDAFSNLRCDYLGLLCLRNDDRVPTTYSSINQVRLEPHHRQVLTEPRFTLLPDEEHLRRARELGQTSPPPPKTGLLFGDPDAPYVVVDDYFIDIDEGDHEAAEAFAALSRQLQQAERDVALDPGEVVFVDNYRAVHGRKPFTARYDGRDRWLKRVSVTRDLRKSRHSRGGAQSRVVDAGRAV